MRGVRSGLCGLAILAGLGAIAIPASDSAVAARMCQDNGQPVCGVKPDGRKTFASLCEARSEGARILHAGACMGPFCYVMLSLDSHPVCGTDPLTHARITYPNNCAVEAANATVAYNGPCRGRR